MRKSSVRLGRQVVWVGHYRCVLGEHAAEVEPERRHLAVGVDLELFRGLLLVFGECRLLCLEQRPGFFEPDMGRHRAAARAMYCVSIVSSSPTPRQSWFTRSPGAILRDL